MSKNLNTHIPEVDFKDVWFDLEYDDFLKISRKHPEISALIRGIKSELAFTTLSDNPPSFNFYYARYHEKFECQFISVPWKAKNFYELILQFVYYLGRSFDLAQPVDMINNYLWQVRKGLEYFGVDTISIFDFEKMKTGLMSNENGILISPNGIEIIPYWKPKEFYLNLLGLTEPNPPNEDRTYVYLMHDPSVGYFKIGRSKRPFNREKTLQSQNPGYYILYFWPREKQVETELHEIFKSKRVRGEWFMLSINDLYKVKDIVETLPR